MDHPDTHTTDVLVIGAGVAGLRAAIAAAEKYRVTLLVKDRLVDSNTRFAQGGIAVALSDEDRVTFHYQDTIVAGAGLSDEKMARILVEEGILRVEELLAWGAEFDREGGQLVFGLEGAHSRRRVLHAGGDSTGKEIVRTLMRKAQSIPSITFIEHAFTRDLILHDGRCIGADVIFHEQELKRVLARAVILATGGSGRIYRYTTNPPFATADGLGIAIRAGATLMDMEFFQFHPTALNLPGTPNFLLSEALRGEGAHLIDEKGNRFMFEFDERGELASRDVVARSIFRKLKDGHRVFLDLRPIGHDRMRDRFPRIYQVLKRFGLDPDSEPVPVTPAAHYYMGGIATDEMGRTSIPGLYAAGEVACNGVHGANRLASNSLLDGLVFGARAGLGVIEDDPPVPHPVKGASLASPPALVNRAEPPEDFPDAMWEDAGVIRNGPNLRRLLENLAQKISNIPYPVNDRKKMESLNGMLTGWALAGFAYLRLESRGAHFREDIPFEKPEWSFHQKMSFPTLIKKLESAVDCGPLQQWFQRAMEQDTSPHRPEAPGR